MYAVSIIVALMLGSVYAVFLASDAPPDIREGYVPGVAVTTAIAAAALAIYWIAYLGHQRSVEIRDGQIHIRSWLRWRRLGTYRSIDLAKVNSALLLRPHHVEFAIPGASTRIGTFYMTKRGVDRFGTFWWYDDEYRALRDALIQQGIDTEYRHIPGLGTLITAR